MQHVVGVAFRNAYASGLQASTHPRDGAVVICALNVDHLGEAAFPLGNVIRHIGHKVSVGAVAFAHHAVFVVAVVGGLEPQRAVLFVGLAGFLQLIDGTVDAAAGVEAGLKVVVVKLDVEGFQVEVLLVAQIGHGKFAHAIQIVQLAAAGKFTVVGLDGFLGQEILRNVLNVVAVVGRCILATGPFGITWLKALCAQLGGGGQGVDLHTRVVVIKLAVHRPALRGKQIANGIAQSGLAAMAHMQWARGIGRYKLHQHVGMALGLLAKAGGCVQDLFDHRLLGAGLEFEV